MLSVVIITYNESANLKRLLPTLTFADEVVVVDRYSEDDTADIARKHGAQVIEHAWEGYGQQKNFAIAQAQGDWILSLDADEIVPTSSEKVLKEILKKNDKDAYYLPRRTHFLGRWIMHGTWYPDWQLRLFKKGATKFNDQAIHERMVEPKSVGYLPEAVIDHYSYQDVSDYIARLNRYTSLEAEKRYASQKYNGFMLLFKPSYRFIQHYVVHRGFLDGYPGFLVALLSAWYVFITHIKIYELRLKKAKT